MEAAKSEEKSAKGEAKPAKGGARQMPPASFGLLLEQYVMQAYMAMGMVPHPATGKMEKDVELARHFIDMLGMLQEKTKGNLTAEEEQVLTTSLYELRMTFVRVSK